MNIGILALQGAVAPHAAKLRELGANPVEVRFERDLEGLSGIVLPGGESTAMIHLLNLNHLWEPLKKFVGEKPAWGVCAGAILLAKEVTHPAQASLGRMNIRATRNAYGRQVDSFIGDLQPTGSWKESDSEEGVFIRAPKLEALADTVKPLLECGGSAVMLEEGNCMTTSFHPELSASNTIHNYFLKKCRGERG